MPLKHLRIALLLDIDGTLIDLAPRPESVVVDARLRRLLDALQGRLAGALALVSGRPISEIDSLFAPLRSAAIGLHGVELRSAAQAAVVPQVSIAPPLALLDAVAGLVRDSPGAFVEDKIHCIALHHRLGEAARKELHASLEQAVGAHAPGWDMIDGHRVFEIKPASVNKGSACQVLLAEPAFRDRLPVYLGDDTTDLDAFNAVRAAGGVPVAVGPRVARHAGIRLATPSAALDWLVRLESALGSPEADVWRLLVG